MSLRVLKLTLPALGFPRVSGDEPGHERGHNGVDEFSPRERG